MPYINLFVHQRACHMRHRRFLLAQFLGGIGVYGLILFGALIMWLALDYRYSTLQMEYQAKVSQWARLEYKEKRFQELIERKQMLAEFEKQVRQVIAQRNVPTQILDIVSQEIDPLGVWLTRVRFNQGRVAVEGLGLTKEDIFQFTENLDHSVMFTHTHLVQLQMESNARTPLFRFTLDLTL